MADGAIVPRFGPMCPRDSPSQPSSKAEIQAGELWQPLGPQSDGVCLPTLVDDDAMRAGNAPYDDPGGALDDLLDEQVAEAVAPHDGEAWDEQTASDYDAPTLQTDSE